MWKRIYIAAVVSLSKLPGGNARPYRTYRGVGVGGISIFGSHVGCLAIDAPIRGEGRQIHRRRGVTQPDDSCIIYLGLISRGEEGIEEKIGKILFKYPPLPFKFKPYVNF